MKNNLKKLLSMILVVSVVLSCITVPSFAASYSKRSDAVRKYIRNANRLISLNPIEGSSVTYAPSKNKTEKSKLTSTQKKYYEIILKNARNIKELEYKNLSDQKFDDLDTAWRAVKADHPEYSNCLFYEDTCNEDGHIDYMHFFYKDFKGKKRLTTNKQKKMLKRDISNYTKNLNSIVTAIINGMPKNVSTIDKYRYFALVLSYCTKYNYAAANASVDDERFQTNEAMGKAWTMDGCLIYGTAVCEGYARAYKHLCNKAGLYCEYVSGMGRKTDSVSHAWNLVKIDNGTYYVDVTWMDEEKINSGNYYNHFLMTEKERGFKVKYEKVTATGKKSYRNILKKQFTTPAQLKGYRLANSYDGKSLNWSKTKKKNIVVEIESYSLDLQEIFFDDGTILPESDYTCTSTELGIKITINGSSENFFNGLKSEYNDLHFNFNQDAYTIVEIHVVK